MDLDDIVVLCSDKALRTARRMLVARMETGQHGDARTLLKEIYAVDATAGQSLRHEIIEAYNTDLL